MQTKKTVRKIINKNHNFNKENFRLQIINKLNAFGATAKKLLTI